MGILDSIKKIGAGIMADAEKALGRVSSKSTMERVVQAAYLIAAADGHVDDSEKVALGRVVARKLPHFKNTEIMKVFEACEEECALSAVAGKLALMESIAKANGTEDAKIIMLSVLAVANADGEFDDNERVVARNICQKLGLRTSDYDL